jgi:hypothetical protein
MWAGQSCLRASLVAGLSSGYQQPKSPLISGPAGTNTHPVIW